MKIEKNINCRLILNVRNKKEIHSLFPFRLKKKKKKLIIKFHKESEEPFIQDFYNELSLNSNDDVTLYLDNNKLKEILHFLNSDIQQKRKE